MKFIFLANRKIIEDESALLEDVLSHGLLLESVRIRLRSRICVRCRAHCRSQNEHLKFLLFEKHYPREEHF